MSLTFAFKDEHELLEKLSGSDCELAKRDLIMFGMYCVEEVDGVTRRVDVQNVELRNGIIVRFTPMDRVTGELILADSLSGPIIDPIIGENRPAKRWMNIMRNALRALPIDTSGLPIWKKHDPGAT